jgi:hypothetical protein
LADLAAGASYLRRRRVLSILSHGEAEARAFVIGISTDATASVDAPDSAGDAVCLAVRFRALALLLCAMLARRRSALPGAAGAQVRQQSRKSAARVIRRPDTTAQPAPDT